MRLHRRTAEAGGDLKGLEIRFTTEGREKDAAPLVLASGSPRRRELLGRLGLAFEVVVSGVDENLAGLAPEALARRLALDKALAVAAKRPDAIVLGADTTIDLWGAEVGKPSDPRDARNILKRIRGRRHRVVTGLALIDAASGAREVASVATEILMRDFSDAEIDAYVDSGEPLDKAGAYAIQGMGGDLVESFDGCYFNVIGLPLCETAKLLRAAGIMIPARPTLCKTASGAPCPRW